MTKWWIQGHYIQVPIWPRWLAQILCPHIVQDCVGTYKDLEGVGSGELFVCRDCDKWIYKPEKKL